jgi:hypothetical protein
MLWHHPKRKREREYQGDDFTIGQRMDIGEAAWDALGRGVQGNPFNMMTLALAGMDVAISAGTAKRGNIIGAGTSAAAAQAAGLTGFIAGRALGTEVGAIIGTSILPGIGTEVGAWAGAIIGGGATAMISDRIARTGVQHFINDMKISRPRVRFGGNFKDSQPAYTMRQKAEQELGGSLLNARRYLGREAQLFHQ